MTLDDHPQQLVEKQESKSPINILEFIFVGDFFYGFDPMGCITIFHHRLGE